MRDHGGDLDRAIARYGPGDWIDLSTGINRRHWPVGAIADSAWTGLPMRADQARLLDAARQAWLVAPENAGVALAGAQAAIQMMPSLRPPGQAGVLVPTYNEYAACLAAQGWQLRECKDLAALRGADLAVVVNPNNPDGRRFSRDSLLELAARVGLLVVDESFADTMPEISLLPRALPDSVLVLRSFGKFYGLAGLRLGFAFGAPPLVARLQAMAGPWPVSGPAIQIGSAALSDHGWTAAMRRQLVRDAARADALALRARWRPAGGTPLFRLYHTADAALAQDHLVRHRIWSRIFPYSPHWLRLGLPGAEREWARLAEALRHAGDIQAPDSASRPSTSRCAST